MKKKVFCTLFMIMGVVIYTISVEATPVTITIFGSGKDNLGNFLPGGAVDPHYTITGYPGTNTGSISAVVVNAGGLPHGTIAEENSLSPDVQGTGDYTYSTTFDLTGLNISTASLTGTWGGDDDPGGVFLNGIVIPYTPLTGPGLGFFGGTYTAASGFLPGVNTLSFEIDQADNYYDYANIGDGTVSANAISTPEPGSATLVTFGLMTFAWMRRRVLSLLHANS